jgi:D-apionolactonase
VSAEILFEGDVFETEDQRNWTDASYKTYSTPLELPFPVEVTYGERISQRVALSLKMQHEKPTAVVEETRLSLTVSSIPLAKPLPKIGLGVATHSLPLSENERQCLARLRLNHFRVDVHFSQADWKRALKQAHDEAIAIGSRLQCALFLNDSAEQSLLDFGQTISPEAVDLCLVFHEKEKSTSSRSLELAERHLVPQGFRLATGTNAYFAELNRQRPPRDVRVCYSLNPQVHAFDDLSLLETLEAQPATVESAAQFCDKGIVISAITLRPRFNPNATTFAQEPQGQLPPTVDPRQRTLFTAAWTLGTLSRLLPLERVESLTFFETTGWQGVLERDAGSQSPVEFDSTPGEIFPVYYVFEAFAGARHLLPVSVSDSQRIAALAFSKEENRSTCLLTNLTRRIQSVDVGHLSRAVSVAMIDETHVPVALESRTPAWHSVPITPGQTSLVLNPMALVKLEFT